MITLCTVFLTVTTNNRIASEKNVRQAQARQVAQAGLDEFAARMFNNPEFLDIGANAQSSVVTAALNAYQPTAGWATLNAGTPQACSLQNVGSTAVMDQVPTQSAACYHIDVLLSDPSTTAGAANELENAGTERKTLTAQVTVRLDCSDTVQSCTQSRYQLILRQRNFIDYLWFTGASIACPTASDPTGTCEAQDPTISNLIPAYTSEDSLDSGPMFTNAQSILVCAQTGTNVGPTFYSVTTTGSSPIKGVETLDPTIAGCSNSASSVQWTTGGAKTFQSGALDVPTFANALAYYSSLPNNLVETPSGTAVIRITGPNTISYDPGTGNVSTLPIPTSGVIVVNGDVTVGASGATDVLSTPLTVYASGNVNVAGSICYAQSTSNPSCATSDTQRASSPGLLGIVAGKNIYVYPQTTGTAPTLTYNDMRIDGSLFAMAGAVYTDGPGAGDDWSTPQLSNGYSKANPPILSIYGAISTYYRSIFSGYDNGDGKLVSGYKKDFHYDSRLANEQPPYFLGPLNTLWARISATELAPNVTDLNASCPTNCLGVG